MVRMEETFIAEVIADNRITIPKEYAEVLKLRKGQKVRITIKKVES